MLVGRAHELGQIDDLIARARSGSGRVVMVEGPSGIGKTALLAEAVRRAARTGTTVLRAVGGPLELEVAFGVVRELFEPVVSRGRLGTEALEGAAGLAAVPLGLVTPGQRRGDGWGDPVLAAMHGLYWLTIALAEANPVMLAVDDAHWADPMSLRFILYLARRLEDVPVLVLVAARPETERAGTRELLAQLEGQPTLEMVRPAALNPDDVGHVLSDRGLSDPEDAFVLACHRASGGNPFLIGALAESLIADGASGRAADAGRVAMITPERVARWVSARLVALGPDPERVASALTVSGADATLAGAASLAGVDRAAAVSAVDALVGANILSVDEPLRFAHPLVRAAIYGRLAPARRADAHGEAARLAAERGAPAARVAAHLLAAAPGGGTWTVDRLREAAGEAMAEGVPRSAAAYLERALSETLSPPLRAQLLLELGEAKLHAGLDGATDLMSRALDLHRDPRRRAEICLEMGRVLFARGEHAAARTTFGRGLAELPAGDDDLFLELRAWYITDGSDQLEVPAAAAARLRALVDDDGPGATPLQRRLLAQLAYHSARSGDRPSTLVARLARRAVADGELLRDSGRELGPFGAACWALVAAGEFDVAVSELTQAIRLGQRRGSWVAFAWFSHLRGIARYTQGDLASAIADLESASAAYLENADRPLPDTQALLALRRLDRDDIPGAVEALSLGTDGAVSRSCSYLFAAGSLKVAQGDLRAGLDVLLACDRSVHEMNAPNPAANLPWRAAAAVVSAQLGEKQLARNLIDGSLELSRRFGAPGALGIALRSAGLVTGGPAGIEQLAQAVSVLDGSGLDAQLARALVDLGAARRRAGRRREALEALSRGLDLASRCGVLVAVRRAREELVAAGARPRRDRSWGADALTASELRIARMASAGLSNPEIAQALFIARKTVTVHLTRTYHKLGISSRAELADALDDSRAAARDSLISA